MLMDPHPSQQHADLQLAIWQLQLEVTRPKARFKTTLHQTVVDGGGEQSVDVVTECYKYYLVEI